MSAGGQVTGTIYAIGETKQVTERFRKRTLAITFADNPKYPQICEFQVTGDRCEDIDRWAEGEIVTVSYNLRGREGNGGRIWNTLEIWKIEPAGDTSHDRRQRDRKPPERRAEPPDAPPPPGDDDIPF